MEAVLIILGLIIGCIIMYFVLRPKLKTTQEYNYKTEEQNKILQHDKECYEKEIKTLRNTSSLLQEELSNTRVKIAGLQAREDQIKNNIEKTRDMIDNDNQIIYQKSFDLMQEKLSQAAEKEANKAEEIKKNSNKTTVILLISACALIILIAAGFNIIIRKRYR